MKVRKYFCTGKDCSFETKVPEECAKHTQKNRGHVKFTIMDFFHEDKVETKKEGVVEAAKNESNE